MCQMDNSLLVVLQEYKKRILDFLNLIKLSIKNSILLGLCNETIRATALSIIVICHPVEPYKQFGT